MEPAYPSGISTVPITDCLDAALSTAVVMSFHIPVCMMLTWLMQPDSRNLTSLLRPLERQLILNLLWLESSIPMSTMSAWVTHEGRKYDRHLVLTHID